MSLRDFAKTAGVGFVTISNIETGKAGASPEMLEKIAKALKCSVSDISEDLPFEPPPDPFASKGIPVVGVVSAERFNFSFDNPPEMYLPLRLDLPGNRRGVALRISGDCMVDPKDPQRSIYEGDYVIIVEHTDVPANGTIVVARLNGEHTLKKIYKVKDGYELRPSNPKYKAISVKSGDLKIVGVFQDKYVPPFK